MLFVSVIIIVLLLAWVIAKPGWAPPVPENNTTRTIHQKADSVANAWRNWWTGSKDFFVKRFRKRTKAYHKWVSEVTLDDQRFEKLSQRSDILALQGWLKDMDESEMKAFLQFISIQCNRQGLKIDWMWDEKLPVDLRKSVEESFVLLSLSSWKAQTAQALAHYDQWKAAPRARKNRRYMHTLYLHLVDKKLVQHSPELLLASEKVKQAQITQAILKAAEENPVEFSKVLKDVLEDSNPRKSAKKETQTAKTTSKKKEAALETAQPSS